MAIALALSIALNLGMWLRHRSGVSPQTPKAATASPSASPILDYWPALSAGYELAKDANALRERGDIKSALVRLQNTAAKDPQNARVHAEMAAIYESIQLFDSALEEWRKVQEIGPLAGELLYELANAKLKIGIAVSTPAIPGSTTTRTTVDSPYENSTDFAKYAMKMREQALTKVEPQTFVPTTSKPATRRFAWKAGIVTTVFWIGEKSNYKSAWDANWTSNYGGFDTPDSSARRNYIPVAFIPHQNPFYCALPYNDVAHGQFKPEAPLVIPWFKQEYQRGGSQPGRSVCKDRWIAIRKGNRTCYAQWEDCGPFRNDHFQYVFGNERPKPNLNRGSGLNVSPAVRDYLDLGPTDVTDWQFIEVSDVPPGPWRSYGDNNHFVVARRQTEQAPKSEKVKTP